MKFIKLKSIHNISKIHKNMHVKNVSEYMPIAPKERTITTMCEYVAVWAVSPLI